MEGREKIKGKYIDYNKWDENKKRQGNKKKAITPQPKATPKHAPKGCMSLLVCECAKTFYINP